MCRASAGPESQPVRRETGAEPLPWRMWRAKSRWDDAVLVRLELTDLRGSPFTDQNDTAEQGLRPPGSQAGAPSVALLYGIACRRRERTRDAGSARQRHSHVSQSGRPSYHRPRSNTLRDAGVTRRPTSASVELPCPTNVNAGRRVAGAVGRLHNPVPRQRTRMPRPSHCGAGFAACLGAGPKPAPQRKASNVRFTPDIRVRPMPKAVPPPASTTNGHYSPLRRPPCLTSPDPSGPVRRPCQRGRSTCPGGEAVPIGRHDRTGNATACAAEFAHTSLWRPSIPEVSPEPLTAGINADGPFA